MSGYFPGWMERLLGIEPHAGQGTAWSLQGHWPWPPWATLLALAAVVALVVGIYLHERPAPLRRRLLLAGLRLAVLAVAWAMLAQLSLSLARTGLPSVALVVDDSQSMGIVDRYGPPQRSAWQRRVQAAGLETLSRWDLARTLLTDGDAALLKNLAAQYQLRMYFLSGPQLAVGGDPAALGAELRQRKPEGPSTRLGAGLRGVLEDLGGNPPAAIVLLSDGINTDGPPLADAARQARRKGVPLFAVGLGDDQPPRDLRLGDLLVEDTVFVGDVLSFEFKLTGTGCAGRKVEIQLRRADRDEPLASTEAVVGPDGQAQALRLLYRTREEGRFRFVLSVPPVEDEPDTADNRLTREVEVRKERIRVLLAQAAPGYEFRYLRNLLARDESIELHTLLQEADLEHAEQDPAALRLFPVRREELEAYDVLILGDLNPALLSEGAVQNVVDFVTRKARGGALVVICGPRFMPGAYRGTPLAELLPVDLAAARAPGTVPVGASTGFQVRPTALGLASPGMQLGDTPAETQRIWQQLPPLDWLLEARDPKPAARVLAVAAVGQVSNPVGQVANVVGQVANLPAPPQAVSPVANPPTIGSSLPRPLPVVAMQFVGAGRVLMHLTDETWYWRRRVGDEYFGRYWLQTIRYLARSKLAGEGGVELDVGRREYQRGESVPLRVRFADEARAPAEDDGVAVVLQQRGGRSERITLQRAGDRRGWFETLLPPPAPGEYHAWLAAPALEGQAPASESRAPAADFTVVAPPGELEHTRMAAVELQQAAELTKGRYYTFATAERLLDDLPEGRQVPIEALPPRPLWNRWPVLALLIGLLAAEWLVRKRSGLV